MDLEGQANVGVGANQGAGPPPEASPEPQLNAPPQGNVPEQPTGAPSPAELYEDTWMGQPFQVPRREATALMYMGSLLQNILREEGQKQAQGQPQPKAAPAPEAPVSPQAPQMPQTPAELKAAMERIASLEKSFEEERSARSRERLIRDTEEAITKHPVFENFKDESDRRFILGLVANHYAGDLRDPRISAKYVGDKIAALVEKAKAAYVTGKVQQATKQPVGRGGAPATSGNPRSMDLNDKGLWEGAEALLREFSVSEKEP